jgi:hypothetical protein
MEALMGNSFEERDFVNVRNQESRSFPESWSVMF